MLPDPGGNRTPFNAEERTLSNDQPSLAGGLPRPMCGMVLVVLGCWDQPASERNPRLIKDGDLAQLLRHL
jgi:hypothetical protein